MDISIPFFFSFDFHSGKILTMKFDLQGVGIFGGFLNNYFGIHTGVQFMAYYASSWIVTNIIAVCGILA